MQVLFISLLFSFFSPGQTVEEFLDFRSSRLNGSIPGALARTELLRLLGTPTKIEPFETECGMTDEKENARVRNWYYYDSTRFFVFDGKAEIAEINFRSGKFTYTTAKIRLSNNTTINDLQKVYPVSTKAALKENNLQIVSIRPCADCDGYCILYFERGRLVRLEWYEDC